MLVSGSQTVPLTPRSSHAGTLGLHAVASTAVLSEEIAVEDRDLFVSGLVLLLIIGLILLELVLIT
jgi:hypothetical protein